MLKNIKKVNKRVREDQASSMLNRKLR